MAEDKKNSNAYLGFAKMFKERENPPDYKEGLHGIVKVVEPLQVILEDGKLELDEGDELIISEWFRFRCNIDKTTALSAGVPSDLDSARGVTETHSYTPNAPCNMPSAISYTSSAIEKICAELLALKCDLKVGDKLILVPTNVQDKYFVMDKVLNVS